MRTIKFRGKRVDRNEWIYGFLIYSYSNGSFMIARSNGWAPTYNNTDEGECTIYNEIIPETVGQFTGLTDKSGVEIYEGDILEISVCDAFHCGNNLPTSNECVEFKNGCFGVVYGMHRDFIRFDGFHKTTFEVIGNTHDNPELLK